MGLTEKEAAARLKTEGANEFEEGRRTGPARIFIGQFRDVMVMILLAATGVSVLLGEISDAVTIILIVLLNAILGFIQEYRTEHTLEALRSMTSPTAKCYRAGRRPHSCGLRHNKSLRLLRGRGCSHRRIDRCCESSRSCQRYGQCPQQAEYCLLRNLRRPRELPCKSHCDRKKDADGHDIRNADRYRQGNNATPEKAC